MINKYALWKNVLILFVALVGSLFALVNIYGSVEMESMEFIIEESTLYNEPRPLVGGLFIPMILWLNKVIG